MKNPFSKKRNNENGEDSGDSFYAKFAENVARFFSAEPQKEKILRHEDFAGAGDTYYASVSARYKVAQRILTLLLVLFLLFSIFTNIKEITYGNVFYFLRDFGNAVDLESTNYETLSYDVYQNQNFRLYRGGIAAISPSNVSVYTATGRRTLKSRSDFVTPYAVCSDKYVLVYDMSGTSFALYNSFSKVYTESFEYPITDAALSDSGVFAVVTRSSDYKSVVCVYNKNIKLVGKYSKNLYALDVAVDGAGERMAVLFYDVGDGRGRTTVRVYDISSRQSNDGRDADEDRIISEKIINYAFPLSCGFSDEGFLSVVTDSSVTVFDEEHEIYDSYGYNTEISASYSGENGTAVAVKTGALNDVNRLVAFDKSGNLLYNEIIGESVSEIELCGKYIFVKSDTGAVRVNTNNGEEEKYDCQSGKMLVYDESTAIICAESKAIYIKFTG
ncbi:MAG: hypothetical protein IJ038_01950 [Clostridia bacterium]|nr:hypothetical protein [Clostridia bacterium]